MYNILVPIDFSPTSYNALAYAVELAKVSKASLTLIHVFTIPVIAADEILSLPVDAIESDCFSNLNNLKESISKHSIPEIECVCKSGFPSDEICSYAREKQVDMIVVGMENNAPYRDKFLGNTTTAIVSKSKCPVLLIGDDMVFRNIRKISLAISHIDKHDQRVVDTFKKFISFFSKVEVLVINVVKDKSKLTFDGKTVDGVDLSHLMGDIGHSFHQVVNEDVIDGINAFSDEMEVDVVVMIPRNHLAIMNLIHLPNTRQMAFKLKQPTLTLH